ncbi:MmoB/DmpM family protein [Raineyella sp. LH-20]|uniref:MmoB/DmpM family protein n=1 Tax=Raineyella sp. LH-20 TaxID=3081204 RepID=UPI002952C4DE|nr:MmoB/DmpM family protein [Raineyella sp. LH-20]WOP19742.1 MmoB/DmpM family protein [Raineyella sp. LH-20]
MTENILDNRPVSIDLQETENNRALITAIEGDNPDLIINHFPGLVKLQAPGRLEINRESVEAQLGRLWETHEFQMAIVTLAGNISEWDEDRIVISWGPKVEDDEEDED